MINIGFIGYGYWGPNVVRNFVGIEGVNIFSICDQNSQAQKRAKRDYPHVPVVSDSNDILCSPQVDSVIIATPVLTHYELAKKALENGKHIFIEKPFTSTASQADHLITLAEKNKLKIMVDHTYLFTSAVKKIKELVENDILGDLCYYDSTRINLGLFQHDVNVIWDLAPHDLSIMDYVIKSRPLALTANGVDHFNRGVENIAYITIYLENNIIAHFNVNWLSPVKIRTAVIGGLKKMLVWNDLDADDKIKVYDKGVEVQNKEGIYKVLPSYRTGDMWSPNLDRTEALKVESKYFVDCITNNKTPINDGHAGLRVVKILEASDDSIKNQGRIVKL